MHACVGGINHPCGILVISMARLFTLITSFPKHTLTQKEWTFCSQESSTQILNESRSVWFTKACQSKSGGKLSYFWIEQNPPFRSAVLLRPCDLLSCTSCPGAHSSTFINAALERSLPWYCMCSNTPPWQEEGNHKVKKRLFEFHSRHFWLIMIAPSVPRFSF